MIIPFLLTGCPGSAEKEYKRAFYTMGSSLEIKLYSGDEQSFNGIIDESIERTREIDRIFSNYRDDSVLAAVNSKAGEKPVKVPGEFIDLTKLSTGYSELTEGAFDITIGNLFELWKSKEKVDTLPDQSEIGNALKCTGFRKIKIEEDTVSFSEDCLMMDFGAIGKGYVVDEILGIAKSGGTTKGLINFGGNIYALDTPHDKNYWEIGIKNPEMPEKILTKVGLKNYAIATSGDYEKHFEINGKKYSHIIKPRTGKPADNTPSVTVAAKTATEADVLSTAFSVMGLEKTKEFIMNRPDIAVLFVVKRGKGSEIFKSPLFKEFEKNTGK